MKVYSLNFHRRKVRVLVVFLFTFVLFVHARVKPTTEVTKNYLRLRFDGIFAIFAADINF